jgi:hypothetical protein
MAIHGFGRLGDRHERQRREKLKACCANAEEFEGIIETDG